ncbi:MAG TPA: type III pantothenate kinase [Candidatus Coprenecus stercoravium]|uniref:Type III pantothenate kinase n=1 Tax=Candidatus Coprenecus stercoravium TaxID=2840735 RepID=A0A9D2GNV3_9BACT|nr:type III pantothenate kinase [Candidatus Coprenecus stercoravium]
MKIILIDIGNSSYCKLAVSDGMSIKGVRRVLRQTLLSETEALLQGDGQADIVCLCSVAEREPSLELELGRLSRRFIRLDSFTPMPLVIDYATPETLGADRIAAAVGAASLFPGESCVIFDFGTALTIDFLTADGRFAGGNISPGLSMRFNAIHRFTDRLPLVQPSYPSGMSGRSTMDAINTGVVSGIMFEVEKYIELNPGSRIVFTGGDSLFFAKKMKSSIFVAYNLVLRGLLEIAQYNNV